MKKIWCVFAILIIVKFAFAEVIISEIELNPAGSDSGNEWIELHSDSIVNLNGWKLINSDGGEYPLNESFEGFWVIRFEKQWLDNKDESVSLINNSEEIFKSDILDDSSNDIKSWQYCNGSWKFSDSSPGSENNCESDNPNFEEETEIVNEEKSDNEENNKKVRYIKTPEMTDENSLSVIRLGDSNLRPDNKKIEDSNRIIYQSKTEIIKKYSVFGFALLCVFLSVLLFWKKLE